MLVATLCCEDWRAKSSRHDQHTWVSIIGLTDRLNGIIAASNEAITIASTFLRPSRQ